jgi:hypothetical protein
VFFVAPNEGVDLRIGRVFADAIEILNLVRQLIALAGNIVEVLIGERTPLVFYLRFEMLPIAFDNFPTHFNLLSGSFKAGFRDGLSASASNFSIATAYAASRWSTEAS